MMQPARCPGSLGLRRVFLQAVPKSAIAGLAILVGKGFSPSSEDQQIGDAGTVGRSWGTVADVALGDASALDPTVAPAPRIETMLLATIAPVDTGELV